MTQNETNNLVTDLNSEIVLLAEKFGRGRLLLAMLSSYWKRQSGPPIPEDLDNRLRRDMGLPEKSTEPTIIWWGNQF